MAPQVGLEPTTLRLTVAAPVYRAVVKDSNKYQVWQLFTAISELPINYGSLPIFTVRGHKKWHTFSTALLAEAGKCLDE